MDLKDGKILDKKTGIVYKPIKLDDYDFLYSSGSFYKLEEDLISKNLKLYSLLHIHPDKHGIKLEEAAKWQKVQCIWGWDFLEKNNKNRRFLCIVNPLTVPQKFYNRNKVEWFRVYSKPSRKLKPETKTHFADIIDNL